jgi:hypothetical protein
VTWRDEERDSYLLGLVRVLLGVLLCIQTWQRWVELDHAPYFADFFHLPLVPRAWVPSEAVYRVLLGVGLLCGALAVVGKRGREALLVGASSGIYLMLCDRLQYHNNRFSLLLFCFLCAFCPCDRSFLLYRGRDHALELANRIAPTLPRRLLAFQVSLLYLASGGGKALDPDWRSGQTMMLRFRLGLEAAAEQGQGPPAWVADLMGAPWFGELTSKAAISLELALAFGLWFARTRVLALWAGVVFHVSIQLSARVELFSWLMGAAYIAFVTPELRERTLLVDPRHPLGRAVRRLVPALDWLARLRIDELAGDARRGPLLQAVDRDGRRLAGWAVLALLCRTLPLLFIAWPLAAALARAFGRVGYPGGPQFDYELTEAPQAGLAQPPAGPKADVD